MICPKCGFEQPESLDCARCGIIFSRYKGATASAPGPVVPPPLPPMPVSPPPPPVQVAEPFSADLLSGPPATPPPLPAGTLPVEPAPHGGTLYDPTAPPSQPDGKYTGPVWTVPQTDLSAFSILTETVSIYLRNIVPFAFISALVLLPVFFALYYFGNQITADPSPLARTDPPALSGLDLMWAALLSTPFATAALSYGVLQELRKKQGTLLACLRTGLTSVASVFGVLIVQGGILLLALGAWILVGKIPVMAHPRMGFRPARMTAYMFLALFAFIGGMTYLFVVFAVSAPAAVEERRGIVGSLSRSAELTAGFRWSVFGVVLFLGLLNYCVSTALGSLFSHQINLPYLTAAAVSQLVLTGLSATAVAVMYYRLRAAQELVEVEELVSVYD